MLSTEKRRHFLTTAHEICLYNTFVTQLLLCINAAAHPCLLQATRLFSDFSLFAYSSENMESVKSGNKYECLLFDMDDTLYPLSTGMNLACRRNIEKYMRDHLHIEEGLIPRMCLDLYKEHGTTMAGLKVQGYSFDDDEFHALVHGKLPYEVLKPDPALRNLLLSMPQRKLIFTNADQIHVERVLHKLGLEDCFHGIICFETLNSPTMLRDDPNESEKANIILCKPALEAMETAVRIANINPKKTIFFDDSIRNIASGKAIGLNTVIVGSSVLVPGADIALENIHNIMEAIPEIWEGEEQKQTLLTSTAPELETVVLA